MSDQTLGEQTSHQQDPGLDYKGRFDGAIRKIEQLTLENRRLNDELVTKTSEIERIGSQLTLKDAEKLAAVGERDKRLQETIQSKTTLESENADLKALKLKVDAAKRLGRPDLLEILETIPNMTDPAALEAVLTTFATFTDKQVAAREKQLMAGVTPGVGTAQTSPSMPVTPQEWGKFIESKPLGSKARQEAMDAQWDFMMKQGA